MKTELGGDRLGSGNKQEISMKNYERSSHDLGYVWRSTMASGTLVPFMSELALPGDKFDIDLDCDVKTLPTIGPLFGSYKVQLDVFQCPVRLYQGKLHMNMLNIGMDMSEVLLPQALLKAEPFDVNGGSNQQVNPSSIWSYLNVRGLGRTSGSPGIAQAQRYFNAIPYLGYWDIYKQYYANKQEEEGVVIHASSLNNEFDILSIEVKRTLANGSISTFNIWQNPENIGVSAYDIVECKVVVEWASGGQVYGEPDLTKLIMSVTDNSQVDYPIYSGGETGANNGWFRDQQVTFDETTSQFTITLTANQFLTTGNAEWEVDADTVGNTVEQSAGVPELVRFPLTNIDDMRMDILESVRDTTPFVVNDQTYAPYGLSLARDGAQWFLTSNQEGLGIKTYQSDLFNNWISTEWIDGDNGINAITSVSTTGDEFTIDALNLANKVYNMLNRIAISGGSYDDWLDAVYTHERAKSCENPIYHGSLIKELAFEEVVSNAEVETSSNTQPLGTLAGRGRLTGKNKGGKVKISVDEPSYLIGLVSITPRLDYSQGNKWDMNLKTMNDLHKPALDEIGFQDLITDQMAWFDTAIDYDQSGEPYNMYQSAGKQPAWINYMTNVNQCRGDFAVDSTTGVGSMFMTLNRNYEFTGTGIGDLTTYVDPSKFNNIFADENLSAQNFWVQISNKIFARRKMSAKVIPNL